MLFQNYDLWKFEKLVGFKAAVHFHFTSLRITKIRCLGLLYGRAGRGRGFALSMVTSDVFSFFQAHTKDVVFNSLDIVVKDGHSWVTIGGVEAQPPLRTVSVGDVARFPENFRFS